MNEQVHLSETASTEVSSALSPKQMSVYKDSSLHHMTERWLKRMKWSLEVSDLQQGMNWTLPYICSASERNPDSGEVHISPLLNDVPLCFCSSHLHIWDVIQLAWAFEDKWTGAVRFQREKRSHSVRWWDGESEKSVWDCLKAVLERRQPSARTCVSAERGKAAGLEETWGSAPLHKLEPITALQQAPPLPAIPANIH